MKQEIDLNNLDLIKAIAYSHYRNKFLWGLSIVAGLLTEGIGYIGVWAMGWTLSGVIDVTVNMLVFIFILNTFGLILTVLALILNPKWRKGRIGVHQLELTENSIIESTKYNKTEILWPAICRVVVKRNYAYFVHQGADVFIIPKRCFSSDEIWGAFTELFIKNWAADKNA